jgi:hypothetical protein
MALHDQKTDVARLICASCLNGLCGDCVDIPRRKLGFTTDICRCSRRGHVKEAK